MNVLSTRYANVTPRGYECIMAVLQIPTPRIVTGAISWVSARDHRLMIRVNHWRPPKWLRLWMLAATRCGDGGLWYALGTLVALYGGPHRFQALLAAAVGVGAGRPLFPNLKRPFPRKRPGPREPDFGATVPP